jgi:hypothetical protein
VEKAKTKKAHNCTNPSLCEGNGVEPTFMQSRLRHKIITNNSKRKYKWFNGGLFDK